MGMMTILFSLSNLLIPLKKSSLSNHLFALFEQIFDSIQLGKAVKS
jgi:hypothetical protein